MRKIKAELLILAQLFLKAKICHGGKKRILKNIVELTGFVPNKVIWRSNYFGTTQIGAVHYSGEYKKAPAVLKIQGIKPEISEAFMIKHFSAQNQSKLVRPPKLLTVLKWDNTKGYEALIMEKVSGKKVIQSEKLQTKTSIQEFFRIYQEYRKKCINKPWLSKPKKERYGKSNLADMKKMVKKVKPGNPFRKPSDLQLIEKAVKALNKAWEKADMEFLHGHFSTEDLIRQDDEVVLFSNLFWKYKYPFYDAVFAYHWFIYSLAEIKGITPGQIEQQRKLWLEEIYSLSRVKKSSKNKKLLKAALLERAVAGILVDSIAYIDESKPIAGYMVSSTRKQLKKLLSELSE